jgi:hypothetical protein
LLRVDRGGCPVWFRVQAIQQPKRNTVPAQMRATPDRAMSDYIRYAVHTTRNTPYYRDDSHWLGSRP